MSTVILVVTSQHPGWAVDPIYPVSFSHVSFHFNFKNPDSYILTIVVFIGLAAIMTNKNPVQRKLHNGLSKFFFNGSGKLLAATRLKVEEATYPSFISDLITI